MNKRMNRQIILLLTTVLLGLALALGLKGVNQGSISARNVQELQNQVIDYQKRNEELNDRNYQLYEYVSYLEAAMEGEGDEEMTHLIDERERYAIFAGMRDVQNSGIVITLQETEQGRMRDSVLRQYVNELSALGAQAISINEERKVAMTEIRANGNDIVINGEKFDRAEPFVIKAIMEPNRLESYVTGYLNNLLQQINSDLEEEHYAMQTSVESDLLIKALGEDRINYQFDLLRSAK